MKNHRKVFHFVLITIISVSLTACNSNISIDNNLFDNTKKNSYTEFVDVFSEYQTMIENYYTSTYDSSLYITDEELIEVSMGEEISKDSLLNYNLTQDREAYNYRTPSSFIWVLKTINLSSCEDLSEGETCFKGKYQFEFYVEDDNILIEFVFVDEETNMTGVIYGFDSTNIYYYIKDTNNEEVKYYQGVYSKDNYEWQINNDSNIIYHDIKNNFMYVLYHFTDSPVLTVYDNPNNESYKYMNMDKAIPTVTYTEYEENKMLLEVDSNYTSLKINLNEIAGWDHMSKVDGSVNEYHIYNNNEPINDEYVARLHSSYNKGSASGMFEIFFNTDPTTNNFDSINHTLEIDDSILSLNVIGLESGYTKTMLDSKFYDIMPLYSTYLTDIKYYSNTECIVDITDVEYGLLTYLDIID